LGVYHVPDLKRPLFKDVIVPGPKFEEAKIGDEFGPSWSTHWFKVEIKVPKEWSSEKVIFNWNCGNEGLIFSTEGDALVGLSAGDRQEWTLPKRFLDGSWHTFYIETSCNALFGNAPNNGFGIAPPIPDKYYTLKTARLVLPNYEARSLKRDFETIAGCVKYFNESWEKQRALEVASVIMDKFDVTDLSTIATCRKIAQKFIGEHVDSDKVFSSTEDGQVYAVGHCHIDTAWLWPYAETRRKIGRSWASQLELIERYPEYNFVCSQAVQYQWLKEDYPDIFDRLKKQAQLGRFMPIGGSWVESDTNMPSGEAIARQFLYGQRFFEANFGVRCKTFWLPDTFGYQAQIPQLCRGAEMDRFVTIKLSWNNINKFPHSTFNWVALDGSQIVSHMPPSDNYNANCRIDEIVNTVAKNKSSHITEKGLLLFGIGDGGGGPTEEMLEHLRRARGVTNTVGKIPRVKMNANIDNYFDEVLEATTGGKDLSSWVGELYFEFHRGTYTTEAHTKLKNRKTEILLHDLEKLACYASLTIPGYKYPKKQLDKMWQDVLLNQFHDVLPGSAIEMVYDDAKEIYANVIAIGQSVVDELCAFCGTESAKTFYANTLPWARSEIVEVDAHYASSLGVSAQKSASGDKTYVRVESSGDNGSMQGKEVTSEECVSAKEVEAGVFVLENATVKATIKDGLVVSLIDKINNHREIIAENAKGNQYVLFDDKPLFWQGWDTEVYSLNTKSNIPNGKCSILESGPLRASVVVEQAISKDSWVKTVISLDAASKASSLPTYLEVNAEVEWNEDSKFLKVEFPVDVYNEEATYDSMYGAVKRPTHYNTSWDMAKFEVCCHKYADLSDHSYGVTVINNSKYGFATHGNIMRLSLLRSSKAPDGNADMGRHHIRYAIQGHKGGLTGQVVRTAWNFNHDLQVLKLPVSAEFLSKLDLIGFEGDDNVIVSTVKRAEDDHDVSTGDLPVRDKTSKSIIVRLYDSLGGRSSGDILSKLPVKQAFRTNLLEDDKEEVKVITKNGVSSVAVVLKRFEIATYRLVLA
jgi:alpha-mannosidase